MLSNLNHIRSLSHALTLTIFDGTKLFQLGIIKISHPISELIKSLQISTLSIIRLLRIRLPIEINKNINMKEAEKLIA